MSVKLNPGDVICYRCNGTGEIINSKHYKSLMDIQCYVCYGEGKLDWIENIVGKESKGPRLVKPGVYVREIDLSTIPSP